MPNLNPQCSFGQLRGARAAPHLPSRAEERGKRLESLSSTVRLLLAASSVKHLQKHHNHPELPSDSVWGGSAAEFSSPFADPQENNPEWESCKGNVLASSESGLGVRRGQRNRKRMSNSSSSSELAPAQAEGRACGAAEDLNHQE